MTESTLRTTGPVRLTATSAVALRPALGGEVEGIMVHLASEESSNATGATFRVDGGVTTL